MARKTGAAAAASPTPISTLPPGPKTPFERRANVPQRHEVGNPLGAIRYCRPFGADLLQPTMKVARVPGAGHGALSVRGIGLLRVGARRVEKPIAHHRTERIGREQRLVDETLNGPKNLALIQRVALGHLQGGLECKEPDEHRESAQHLALGVCQKLITPVQCRLQGSLTWRSCAPSGPRKAQPLIQKRRCLFQPIGRYATGCQLDGERDATEFSAGYRL